MILIQKLENSAYRKFGFTISLMIILIFEVIFPWAFELKKTIWPWILSISIFFISLTLPSALKFIYKPFILISHYLGLINSKIILTIIFFFILFPFSLFFKLIGKNIIKDKFNNKSIKSYWVISKKYKKEQMEKVY